jgi:hypothetical protein
MSIVKLFILFEIHKLYAYFKTKTLAKSITSLLFFAVFAFVGVGIYSFFVSGFRYINVEAADGIQAALTLYIYELFFIVLSVILALSSLIGGIFGLFRAENASWIISTPGYLKFPHFIAYRTFFRSLLPATIMFFPAITAFNHVYHLGYLSALLILVSLILLLVLVNMLVLSVLVVTGYIYYRLSISIKRFACTFKGYVSLLFGFITLLVIAIGRSVTQVDLVKLFRADEDTGILGTALIGEHFSYLPTHPFAMELVALMSYEWRTALFYFFILCLSACTSLLVWYIVAPLYFPVWKHFQDKGSSRTSLSSSFTKRSAYHFAGNIMSVLIKKEILVATRNWKGVLWFFFLSLIWLLQIGANVILGHTLRRYEPDITAKTVLLETIQFVIAIYFISSFTLRFVFTSFSVEKKTSWILRSAPLNAVRLFFSKYFFYCAVFLSLGLIMNAVNSSILAMPFMGALYSMILFLSTIIWIVTCGLSLGALFPNKDTDDPEVISTSMPGLFFTAISLLYGALCAYALYQTLSKHTSIPLYMSLALTFISIFVVLVILPARIRKEAKKD